MTLVVHFCQKFNYQARDDINKYDRQRMEISSLNCRRLAFAAIELYCKPLKLSSFFILYMQILKYAYKLVFTNFL